MSSSSQSPNKKQILDILLLGFVFLFVVAFPFDLWIHDVHYLLLAQTLARLAYAVFFWIYRHYSSLQKEKREIRGKNLAILSPIVLLCGCNFVYLSIVGFIGPDLGDGWLFALKILLSLVTAAAEECFFREALLRHLSFSKPFINILVSSAIFGLVHILTFISSHNPFDLLQIAYATGIGIVCGFLYHYGGSLLSAFVFHALFNILNNDVYSLFAPNEIHYSYYIVAASFALYGLLLLGGEYLFLFQSKKAPKGPNQTEEGISNDL